MTLRGRRTEGASGATGRKLRRRWFERAILGTFMAVAALIIEWRVRRALRRTGGEG